ncbi:MAG: hypothetical protein ACLFRD_07290 [Nitriliruptoraceae bacterium]
MNPDHASCLHTCLRRHEAGEGVISTAIAVLIMALIGAAMWAVFSGVFTDSADLVEDQVGELQPIE